MSPKTVEYTVRVHQEEGGALWAEVVELPGCLASGDSLDELREAVTEAIALYLSDGEESQDFDVGLTGRSGDLMTIEEMRVTVSA
jgi:predicted RNase H-like HicB family nuclease